MSPLILGVLVSVVTVAVLITGAPVAFSLGAVAIGFLLVFDGFGALSIIPNIFYGGLDNFALLSIPMFILMGGAIASSRAGPDLYEALDRWLYRVPGGLMVSNIGACAIFDSYCIIHLHQSALACVSGGILTLIPEHSISHGCVHQCRCSVKRRPVNALRWVGCIEIEKII